MVVNQSYVDIEDSDLNLLRLELRDLISGKKRVEKLKRLIVTNENLAKNNPGFTEEILDNLLTSWNKKIDILQSGNPGLTPAPEIIIRIIEEIEIALQGDAHRTQDFIWDYRLKYSILSDLSHMTSRGIMKLHKTTGDLTQALVLGNTNDVKRIAYRTANDYLYFVKLYAKIIGEPSLVEVEEMESRISTKIEELD